MALQTSGAISLNEIHIEAGGSSGSQAALNDADIRALISKSSGAQMSFSEWYGASAAVSFNGDHFDLPNMNFGSIRTIKQLQPSQFQSNSTSHHWMNLYRYEDDATCCTFSHDGTKLFVMGIPATAYPERRMYRYDMSTAWDITTAVGQTGLSGTTQNGYTFPNINLGSAITFPGYNGGVAIKFFDSGNKFLMFVEDGNNSDIYYASLTTAYDISTGTWTKFGFNLYTTSSMKLQYWQRNIQLGVSDDLKTIVVTGDSGSPYGRVAIINSSSANQFSSGASAYTKFEEDLRVFDPSSTAANQSSTFIIGMGIDAGGTFIQGYSNAYHYRFVYRLGDNAETLDGSGFNSATKSIATGGFNNLTTAETDQYRTVKHVVRNNGTSSNKGLAWVTPNTVIASGANIQAGHSEYTWCKYIQNITYQKHNYVLTRKHFIGEEND